VLHCWATDEDDSTDQPRWGRIGKQRIDDTGPLTKKRMETVDDEVLEHGLDFIDRQAAAGTPFFVWFNTTHMHFRTHPKPESVGQAGRWQSTYHDTMIDHDTVVGALLDKLDELRVPKLFNLRTDPFERADVTSNTYWDWFVDSAILVITASAVVAQFLETFKEFPPRQKAASFTIDQAMAKLEAALTSGQ
jgi:hypothetical protein